MEPSQTISFCLSPISGTRQFNGAGLESGINFCMNWACGLRAIHYPHPFRLLLRNLQKSLPHALVKFQ